MVLNALFPVFALILTGILLRRIGIVEKTFFRNSDRLVYYVLFPVMLFWKIGAASLAQGSEWHYLIASLCAVTAVFFLSLLFIRLTRMNAYKAGTFSQSCYRFNTYIGMAVVINLFGEKGVQLFAILVGVLIPIINVMSVGVLVWHDSSAEKVSSRLASTMKTLMTNPLILGCLAGIGYAHYIGGFPQYIDNFLRLLSSTTLPLALFSIGGALSFQSARDNAILAGLGAVIKLVFLPLTGWFSLYLFHVQGITWQVSMLFFSLPASTAIYVLSAQLHSDTELASAAIVLSTLSAFFTMSVLITWIT
ncbi:AEC family transporter [Desulfogranum japonicum]|uniref:AEC family transporter n=1 Tax=Desulfogranum japonicum TaxID=231447 RepID=UPI00041C4115|nr:AEC family transporter [Desulfogranum japonicum]